MKSSSISVKLKNKDYKKIPLNIKIDTLNKDIDQLLASIESADLNNINEFDDNILKCSEEIGNCDELARTSENQEYIGSMQLINNKFRNAQSKYISKKFTIMNEKLDNAVNESNDRVNSLTGNMLLSVIALFLGISLTSAMITTAGEIESQNRLILYYFGIAWIVVFIIGMATVIMRKYDRKTNVILAIIVTMSIVLIIGICKLS